MPMFLSKLSLLFTLVTPLLYGYSFTMQVDNTQPMVGETIHLTTHFRYDNIEEYDLAEPDYEHFNIALVDENETQENNSTWLVTQHYTLIAKKTGTLTLHPLKAHIEFIPLQYQKEYNKNHYLQKQDIFTQALTLQVAPLPQGIQVTGDYTLEASIDKNQSTQGSPVQFTVSLIGEGNLENLNYLTLHIPHTTIYEKSTNPQSKTFSILANQNYIIPPIVLKYFNQKSKTVMLTSTASYAITIHEGTSYAYVLWVLLFLLLASAWYGLFVLHTLRYVDKKHMLIKALKACKNKEALLKKVAPYIGKDRGLTRLIYRLEGCNDGEFKEVKKEIIKHFYRTSCIIIPIISLHSNAKFLRK